MRRSRYSKDQVAMALRDAEAGTPVAYVCRELGIAETTFYRWKKRYGGQGGSEPMELRQLRAENRKLRELVAELSLDNATLRDALKTAR